MGSKNETDVKYSTSKPLDVSTAQDVASSSSTVPRTVALANALSHKASHKPPRPASLDRRRLVHHHTRYERDSKSRSAHSLQEAPPTPESKCPPRGKRWTAPATQLSHQTTIRSKPTSVSIHSKAYLYPKEGSNSSKSLSNYHRPAPIIWERPHFQQWEPDPPPPACNYNYHGSRDELRMLDYHRRQHDFYRYDSDGMLSAPPPTQDNPRYCNRYMSRPVPAHSYCSCECRQGVFPSMPSSQLSWDTKYQV